MRHALAPLFVLALAACSHAPAKPPSEHPAPPSKPVAPLEAPKPDEASGAPDHSDFGLREMAGLPEHHRAQLPPKAGPEDVRFGACDAGSGPRGRPGTEGAGPSTLLMLSRGPCFGTCPSYDLTLRRDGTLDYEGERCVATHGHCTARVSPAQLDRVVALLRAAKLSGHTEDFQPISDLPRQRLWVGPPASDHPASVEWNAWGNRYDDLADALDRLLGTAHWVGPRPSSQHCRD